MTNKEHVLKYGGKFSISGGEVWTMPNGHDVHFALNPKMGCRGANIAVGFHKPGKEFAPHKHPISEEILIIHSGKGECTFMTSGFRLRQEILCLRLPASCTAPAIQRKIQRTL